MTSLERLYLPECDVKDEGMVHLVKCPSLKYLNLSGTGVTKAGIETLQKCPKLEELMLRYMVLGKDAVGAIAGIKTLKEVYYPMDDKEKEQLKKLAPMLKVSD